MQDRRAARSVVFVAASLAAHTALLLLWGGSAHVDSLETASDAVLTVSLASEPQPGKSKERRSRTDTSTQQILRAGKRQVAPTEDAGSSASSAAPDMPETDSTAEGRTAENTPAEPETRAWLRARVSYALGRYFTYPPLARQRGLSGTVVLSYRVEADGRLEDIAVARSSGYALLDRSALIDLARVPPLTDAIPRLRGATLEETLAVIYRLRDN
jgi:protein TonB